MFPKGLARFYNYGVFSSRYGNIYTARQLKQLIGRAYGSFVPRCDAWQATNERFIVDPFRPQIQAGGFVSRAELEQDRISHLACVRRALEEMDVFVFTLGLTECWEDPEDGAVYPLAPGVAGGQYEVEKVRFVNFDEAETYADLEAAISYIRSVNPDVRIVLTVSPVPLNATYVDQHVLLSTSWSKAVLRIVAERARKEIPNCAYFPSYEIITSPHVRGRYFAEDCRSILQDGVDHAMGVFLRNFSAEPLDEPPSPNTPNERPQEGTGKRRPPPSLEDAFEILCDEASIDNC